MSDFEQWYESEFDSGQYYDATAKAWQAAIASMQGEAVAFQRRPRFPMDKNVLKEEWEPCSGEEYSDTWKRLPGYEYRQLYTTSKIGSNP